MPTAKELREALKILFANPLTLSFMGLLVVYVALVVALAG